jgi:hypothetical protein
VGSLYGAVMGFRPLPRFSVKSLSFCSALPEPLSGVEEFREGSYQDCDRY